jgi:ribosomal protein S18 acetylase RimI-like enzyme
MISIRRIRPGEGLLFKDLRLAALKESPSAFSSTYGSAIHRSRESWSEQADSTATGTDRCTFLAFADESPMGIAAIYRDKRKQEEGEILQVWVAPDYRGSGAARELLDTVLRWCAENGIRRVSATITRGNDRALKFYRKYGFAPSTGCDALGGLVLVRSI